MGRATAVELQPARRWPPTVAPCCRAWLRAGRAELALTAACGPVSLRPPKRRPVCHVHNLDAREDSVFVLLDEQEGVTKDDIPPFDMDDGGSGSDDENDPPPKQ